MKRATVTDCAWRARPPAGTTDEQTDWLCDHASLTARLRARGPVRVIVLREGVDQPLVDERLTLGRSVGSALWCREVVLAVAGTPFVYARSVTPILASRHAWRAIRSLGTRPLAELLYTSVEVSRSGLASQCITPAHPLFRAVRAQVGGRLPHRLLARRSVFRRHDAPLLVTECMLPPLWRL